MTESDEFEVAIESSSSADLPCEDLESEERLERAVALIDEGLGGLTERQLVSASEITDLLLDVRSLIAEPV